MRTQEQLNQIAVDIFHGRAFCDRQIPETESLEMVFMIIALMDQKDFALLKAREPGMIFEYLDKASPRSCNGLPCFFSMQILNKEETGKVLETIRSLREGKA